MSNSNSQGATELREILDNVNVNNIEYVIFSQGDGTVFRTKNKNIKKLATYITSTLSKNTFAPEELRSAYEFVIQNIQTELPQNEFDDIKEKISGFVHVGGKITIKTTSLLKYLFIIILSAPLLAIGGVFALCGGSSIISWNDGYSMGLFGIPFLLFGLLFIYKIISVYMTNENTRNRGKRIIYGFVLIWLLLGILLNTVEYADQKIVNILFRD